MMGFFIIVSNIPSSNGMAVSVSKSLGACSKALCASSFKMATTSETHSCDFAFRFVRRSRKHLACSALQCIAVIKVCCNVVQCGEVYQCVL